MISRDAVRILMLSPLYFHLNARQRLNLVREYSLAMNSFSLTTEKKHDHKTLIFPHEDMDEGKN